MAEHERRAFQRLKLVKPILATLDGRSALILDIGVGGAFIEHRGRAMPGLQGKLIFRWQGAEIAFDTSVIRSSIIREGGAEGLVSQSAVSFTKSHADSAERLQHMMATFVGQVLAAHRDNVRAHDSPNGAALLQQIGQARRARSRGLVTYHWDGTTWSHGATESRVQPRDGFTVAAYEDEEELATLCAAYETADDEGRQLIRLVAELSVRSAMK